MLSFNPHRFGFRTLIVSFNNEDQTRFNEQRMFLYTGWEAGETHHVFMRVLNGLVLVYADGVLLASQRHNGAVLSSKCHAVTKQDRAERDQGIYSRMEI